MRTIIEAASTGSKAEYRAAAAALDDMAAAGEIPRGDEFYATVCSALCYDIAGMRGDAVRMYRLLEKRYTGEFEYIVRSPAHAMRLVRGLASLGMGDGGRLLSAAVGGASEWILSQAPPGSPVEHDTPDDYNVFMATVMLLCRFYEALRGPDSDGKAKDLAQKAGSIYDELLQYYPDPPLGFMASLYLRLIEATYERAAARLDITDGAREALWRSGSYALAEFEEDAVAAGMLERASLVCRLPAGRGKQMLASLCLGAARGGELVAYLAADERAVDLARDGIVGLLGTDWGSGGGDSRRAYPLAAALGGRGHFMATYRELALLLLSGGVKVGDLKTVVIDEACDLDEDCGGSGALELEMLLARLLDDPDCPQIVAFTSRASAGDAKRMAAWLGAGVVDGAPAAEEGGGMIGADESVYYGGMLHPRSRLAAGPLRDLLCRDGASAGQPDTARLCACFARRAAVSGAPLLISIPPESDAPGLASLIAARLGGLAKDDLDLDEAVRKGGDPGQIPAGREAILACIERRSGDLAAPLGSGVAFDDGRMPQAFRRAVIGGVEDGSISTVVSSSPPYAQAGSSPFKTVLFCDPGPGGTAGAAPRSGFDMSAFRYAQVAEMAGRAGRDRRGEVFVLPPTGAGPDPPRPAAWDAPRGAASSLAGRRGGPRPDIAAHLLRMAGEQEGGVTLDAAMHRMSLTWLRASSGPAAVDALAGTIEGILEELAELGLAARRKDGGGRLAYGLTDLGARFCISTLPVLPAARAVQGLKRLRKMVGEYAAQFYLEALRAAWSVVECGPDGPLRGAPGSAPDPRLLARYGWQGRAGAAPAVEGEAGLHLALRHYAFAAAGTRAGVPASRTAAAGTTAVDMARALLELADLAGGRNDRGEGVSEGLAYIATRCMLNSLEGGAGLLERCTAETERGRAAFLIDSLSGRPAGPRWLRRPPSPAPPARPASPGADAEPGRALWVQALSFFAGNAARGDGEPALHRGTAGAPGPAALHVPALDTQGAVRKRIFAVHAWTAGLPEGIVLETSAARRGPVPYA